MSEMNSYSWERRYLSEGEVVLWRGKQENIFRFEASDLFISAIVTGVLFSMLLNGRPIKDYPAFIIALAMVLVISGSFVAAVHYCFEKTIIRKTEYVITNQSVMKRQGDQIDVLELKKIKKIQLREGKDGIGSIYFDYTFGNVHISLVEIRVFGKSYPQAGLVIQNIANVKKIYEMLDVYWKLSQIC